MTCTKFLRLDDYILDIIPQESWFRIRASSVCWADSVTFAVCVFHAYLHSAPILRNISRHIKIKMEISMHFPIRASFICLALACMGTSYAETCDAAVDLAVSIGELKTALEITTTLSAENPDKPELLLPAMVAQQNVQKACDLYYGPENNQDVYPAIRRHMVELCRGS